MKSFKEYLLESKQTYDFKIKIAGDCPDGCAEKIKEALSMYDVASCSSGASTPIQESHFDFPTHKNVKVTTYEVCLNYPVIGEQVLSAVTDKLNLTRACVIVRNPLEEAESLLNHSEKTADGALLEKGYDKDSNQDLVGEKKKANFLKELGKTKTQGTAYKGANEKILAKKSPTEKSTKTKTTQNNTSPVGSRKVTTLPTAKTVKGR